MLIFFLFQVVFCDWYHSTLAFTLSKNNIEQHIGKSQHVILDFFTPWCMYCQHMAGEYNRVFEHYKESRPDILIAKLNCDEQQNQHICHSYGVHSFPTILYFAPESDRPTSSFQNHRRYDFFVQWIDQVAIMSDETKQHLQQKELERLEQEKKEQEEHLQELMRLEKLKEIEAEEQMKKIQQEADTTKSIAEQITDIKQYISTISNMEKEIILLQQQVAELNQKVGTQRQQSGLQYKQALILTMLGLCIGIGFSSCVFMLITKQKLKQQVHI